jgi:quercetin dioxygenase-like cupin family protein
VYEKEKAMESRSLLSHLEFHDSDPYAKPILVNQDVRILRWMLKPGQSTNEHTVPDSPLYIVVIQGRGLFAGRDGRAEEHGPASLIVFAQGESHSVRALDEELIFLSFMDGAEVMRPEHTGGEIGREAAQS